MKCPIDGEILLVSERQGVEIDYCPKCRGIWLDRGELDKIIDQAAGMMLLPDPEPAPAPPEPTPQAAPQPRIWTEPYREALRYEDAPKSKKKRKPYKKRKNSFGDFLEDLFDFD